MTLLYNIGYMAYTYMCQRKATCELHAWVHP